MSLAVTILNRQRTRPINARWLRQIVSALLNDLLGIKNAELGITLVAAPEMTRLNEAFLQHGGSTDVITFDYAGTALPRPQTPDLRANVHGEIFVCVDEAVLQARRFRTTWQSEVIRYLVHGVLHLLGHDDHRAADRRRMKRAENRLVRLLAAHFAVSQLAQKTKPRR